jgi:hypothetical protein
MGDDGGGTGSRDPAGAAGAAASAGAAGSDLVRAEMGDAPPFLSWRAIYLIVLGALVVEMALGAVLSVLTR